LQVTGLIHYLGTLTRLRYRHVQSVQYAWTIGGFLEGSKALMAHKIDLPLGISGLSRDFRKAKHIFCDFLKLL